MGYNPISVCSAQKSKHLFCLLCGNSFLSPLTVKKVSKYKQCSAYLSFSRFSKTINLPEWFFSFSHLNRVLNAENTSVGDNYVASDQSS